MMTDDLTRRSVLRLVGMAALFGQRAQPPIALPFPKGAIIRTLLKDMPPDALAGGPVLFHEHLSMHFPPQAKEHFTAAIGIFRELDMTFWLTGAEAELRALEE